MDRAKSVNRPGLVTFARLPIFDNKKNLWGYELVYIPAEDKIDSPSDLSDIITSDLISDTSLALDQMIDKTKKIMVHLTQKNILDNLPYALTASQTAIKITDPANLSGPLLQRLKQLKKDGYQVAVIQTRDHTLQQDIFELADMICMDISGMRLPGLTDFCNKKEAVCSRMLATHVDDPTGFEICRQAGFSFFQGSFFKQPENVSVKKILPGTISRFQLLKAIEQENPDFSKLADTIQADVAISFRLLSHLNSASFGFRQKIDSIKDAITILGWNNLKKWLRVVLLSQVSQSRHASELIFLSAHRGKFLEQVGIDHDFWGFDPDSLFLLGMFSLLDALLNQPMPEIVKYLPLPDKLKSALCMEGNNEYVPLLNLVQYFEEAQFNQSDAMINQLGLDPIKVKQAYCRSIDWANQLQGIKNQ